MKVEERLRFDRTLDNDKRIETGSFYTPPRLAEFMVCLSLSNLLAKKRPELNFSQLMDLLNPSGNESIHDRGTPSEVVSAIGETLKTVKVLDLCAGTGIFPLAYFKVLSHFFINAGLATEDSFKKMARELSQNVFAVDIQPEPLKLYTDELEVLYDIPLNLTHVFCLDALSDEQLKNEPVLLGEMEKGFDLILGNPPYLGEKHHKGIFQALRQTPFGAKYYEGRMDYFYFFIYRGLEALKADGQLCMITTNYFTTADGAKYLRQYLQANTSWDVIVNFNDCALFKDALGQHNMIFSLTKYGRSSTCHLCYPKGKEVTLDNLYTALIKTSETTDWDLEIHNSSQVFDSHGMVNIQPSHEHQEVLNTLQYIEGIPRQCLGEFFHVQQGIVSGYDRDFKENQGVFVLTSEEARDRQELTDYLKPFYKNSQIRKYMVTQPTQYEILYVSEVVDETLSVSQALLAHLNPYYQRLSQRREVIKGIRPWYALQWPRESWRFKGPLIAAPQRAFVNVFAYEEGQLHGSADIYYISDRLSDPYRRERTLFMTAYLNSPLIYYWLALKGKRKGSMLELYATPLKNIPILIYNPEQKEHQKIVAQVQSVMSALKDGASFEDLSKGIISEINRNLYELIGLSESQVDIVEAFYRRMGAETSEENYWYTR